MNLSPTTVSHTLWVSFFWGLMSHTMRLYATFLSWGTLCLWMKKHVYVPPMSLILWNRNRISLAIALVHLGLSGPFIRCLYSWDLPVSGKTTVFICNGWIFTSPVFCLCAPSLILFCVPCMRVIMLEVV